MTAPTLHSINDQHFWLSHQRAIYWEEAKALIISDLHIGKTGHFRKSGIAVPQLVFQEDLQRLVDLIRFFQPEQIIAVGDLFHSHHNKELDLFYKWRNDFKSLSFLLVKGNHDILIKDWYQHASIEVQLTYQLNDFFFIHDPKEIPESSNHGYVFSGHLHPGVVIRGAGKQNLRFPCFYFNQQQAILPAFSHFSGLAVIEPKKTDDVYAIVNQSLVKIA